MSSSSHAIWQVGLFKKLNKDQTECTVCQKVLSSKNHTVNGLVKHLAIHKDARSKYLDLQKSRSDGNGSLDNFVVRPSGNR